MRKDHSNGKQSAQTEKLMQGEKRDSARRKEIKLPPIMTRKNYEGIEKKGREERNNESGPPGHGKVPLTHPLA